MIIKVTKERRLELNGAFGDYLKSCGYFWERLINFQRCADGTLVYTLK